MIHDGWVVVHGWETQFEGEVRARNLMPGLDSAKRKIFSD